MPFLRDVLNSADQYKPVQTSADQRRPARTSEIQNKTDIFNSKLCFYDSANDFPTIFSNFHQIFFFKFFFSNIFFFFFQFFSIFFRKNPKYQKYLKNPKKSNKSKKVAFSNFFFDIYVHEIGMFQRRPAQTWSKRLPTVIVFISIIYYKLLQSIYDTFYLLLVTLKTLQSRIFNIFF